MRLRIAVPPPPPHKAFQKNDDLLPLAHSFTDNVRWDALCIQEGVRHRAGGVVGQKGLTIISGQASQVGAPYLILKPRLGSRLRR